MGSLENKYINLTGQYTIGKGNNKGDKTTKDNKSKKFDGWSVFGELKPLSKIGLFGRYDNFTWNKNEVSKHYATGLSYSPIESYMGLVSFDLIDTTKDKESKKDWQTNLMLRIKY